MQIYKKNIQYLFEIRGHEFSITQDGIGPDGAMQYNVEDTRKNGQEDCHAFDLLYAQGGEWKFEGDGKSFDDYSDIPGKKILEFLTQNPFPIHPWD